MYVKRRYGFLMTLRWSIKPLIITVLYATVIQIIFYFLKIKFSLPWQAVSVLGVAVAFYLGFKNNSSYDRTWGGIVNNSRTFGAACTTFIQGEKTDSIKKELIYRHIAWMTALRYQLRLSRTWEHTELRVSEKYFPNVCEKYRTSLENELSKYIPTDEVQLVNSKSNAAVQILAKQSQRLQELKDQGYFEDFRHMEFHHIIENLYTEQGKAERIKNFPFPRQYASTAVWLTMIFSALVPFAMLSILNPESGWIYWLSPLISGLIVWSFALMEMIGDYSENPFEGTYNDVPITAIAIGIEIDLREMIDDSNIPEAIQPVNGFLM